MSELEKLDLEFQMTLASGPARRAAKNGTPSEKMLALAIDTYLADRQREAVREQQTVTM